MINNYFILYLYKLLYVKFSKNTLGLRLELYLHLELELYLRLTHVHRSHNPITRVMLNFYIHYLSLLYYN